MPANQPNPHHQPNTFSTADVQSFECEALGADHPEVQERERLRNERLQKSDNLKKHLNEDS